MTYALPTALRLGRPWLTHDRIPPPGVRRALRDHRVRGMWLAWDNKRKKWALFVECASKFETYAYVMTLGQDGTPTEPGPWLINKIDEMDTALHDPAEEAIRLNEAHDRNYRARCDAARKEKALKGERLLLDAFNMPRPSVPIGVSGFRR